MKKMDLIPGTCYVLKQYHEALLIILKEWGQTQAEAAKELGVSMSTFQKMLRLRWLPNFRTPRGKVLADRIRRWSGGFDAEFLFPPALFTREFVNAPKTHTKSVTFRLLAQGTGVTLQQLPSGNTPHHNTQASQKKRRNRKKSKI